MERKVYRELASSIDARIRCNEKADDNSVMWCRRHTSYAEAIVKMFGPSGSGLDSGTQLDLSASTGEKLVFQTSFHHMNDVGSYDGWTEHTITVKASLIRDIDIKISGRDRNDIKDYLYDVFYWFLQETITEEQAKQLATEGE